MEPNRRDTPIRRFNTFWWALALFVVFGIACYFIRTLVHDDKPEDFYTQEEVDHRAKIRREVDAAQAAQLTYKKLGGDKVQMPPSAVKYAPEIIFNAETVSSKANLEANPERQKSDQAHGKSFQ